MSQSTEDQLAALVRRQHDAIEDLRSQANKDRARIAKLEECFKHTHQAKYNEHQELLGGCGRCDFDIRDLIHE